MKRYAFYMLALAVAAVAACQKPAVVEEPELQPEVQPATYTYTINASMAPETKSDYDASGHFTWSAGDAISVLFHNGDDNKFFTLTTTGTGASASFSGEITAGYEIGASDGTVSDKKIWALFPANANHSYTAGTTPTFYLPPTTDFTEDGAHYSANMPMYALQAAEGSLAFINLCSGYKFTFTNIASSVHNLQVVVDNNAATYKFSGTMPLVLDGEEYCIKPDWGDEGVERMQTYVAAVDDETHSVVVYVPTRRNTTYFQPVIDVFDYDTGYKIAHKVASSKKASPVKGKVQPITINTGNSVGSAPSFTSSFGIDWPSVTVSSSTCSGAPAGTDGVKMLKATSDASYIYIYLEVDKSSLLLDSSYDYANPVDVYLGDPDTGSADWKWNSETVVSKSARAAWLTKYGAAAVNSWEGIYAGSGSNGGHAEQWGKLFFYEVKLKRSYNACMQITGTENIAIVLNYEKYNGGGGSKYMYTPKNGDRMLEITLPAYVAPE